MDLYDFGVDLSDFGVDPVDYAQLYETWLKCPNEAKLRQKVPFFRGWVWTHPLKKGTFCPNHSYLYGNNSNCTIHK